MIKGKRVLIVEDELDVIDVLIELLDVCKIDAASSFGEGKKLLEENDYDIAILDIMGVRGFDLLALANARKIPAMMLTAHGLSEGNLQRSVREGAVYYAPKEEMKKIATFMADVLVSIAKNKSPWERLLDRLGGFYDRRFGGTDWRKKELEFVIKKGGRYM
ncbi:MAG: response regulator [Candidatus Omnitrophota bacterium]